MFLILPEARKRKHTEQHKKAAVWFVLKCCLNLLYCLPLTQPMIQLEKPVLTGTMPVVWPTILDLGRDECKRILRKLGKAA